MKDKKTIIYSVVILLLVIVATIGASYAYFAAATKTTGNDENLNIVTEDLGSIKWEGTKVFESGDLLPGECGIQTFTIEKNSTSGKGIYEIDLKGILDESFGTDVEITLYKSTDINTNNVTIKEGSSTISGDTTKQYYKEDSVVVSGTPEKVYGTKALKNKEKIILEQVDFDNSTLEKTTYYLVYCYKNNGNQDKQQGKSFSGEISVRLILEKSDNIDISNTNAIEGINRLLNAGVEELAVDDYGNVRYIGANPNNYIIVDGEEYANDVYFGYLSTTSTEYQEYSSLEECTSGSLYKYNCKVGIKKGTSILWRIIGIMKDIDDGTGKKEDRLKIIRSNKIGNYSWDTSASNVNGGYGVNEWSQADTMKLLNPGYESESVGGSLYWDNKSGMCYDDMENASSNCNFTSIGIKDGMKKLIGDAVWNTGASTSPYFTTKDFYQYERGTKLGKIYSETWYSNDKVTRTTTWTGKIGLMYPSDYGYATGGGDNADRTTCLSRNLRRWIVYDYYDPFPHSNECIANDWMPEVGYTMTPYVIESKSGNAYSVFSNVASSTGYSSSTGQIYPTAYLLSKVGIKDGIGSSSDPFVLGI